jgi:IS30 family transposase
LKKKGYSWKEIGDAMNRAKSAVWTEWKRNKVKGRYVAEKAHHKAYARRKYSKYQGKKIVDHQNLRDEIVFRLKDKQKPGNIAKRITRREKYLPSISKNAIYAWLDSSYGAPIAAWLSRHAPKRRHRRGYQRKLEGRTFIEKRPRIVDNRGRVGDVEFDFIVSGKSGKGILLTVADRKIRKGFIEKILPVSIRNFEKAFLRIKKRFPEMKTGTTDNDLLLQRHKYLERLLHAKIYFCHPYHSYEKGSIENVNGQIRQDIPKGSDISQYSRQFIRKIEARINRRPMDVLHSFTPDEMYAKYKMRVQKHKTAR